MTTDDVNNNSTSENKLEAADNIFKQLSEDASSAAESAATVDAAIEGVESLEVGKQESLSEVTTEEVVSEQIEATESVVPSEDKMKEKHPDMCWYVVNAYSGYEVKVKSCLLYTSDAADE